MLRVDTKSDCANTLELEYASRRDSNACLLIDQARKVAKWLSLQMSILEFVHITLFDIAYYIIGEVQSSATIRVDAESRVTSRKSHSSSKLAFATHAIWRKTSSTM